MLVICILMIILLLIYAGPAGIAAKDAITLFLTSVLPSLLPFYIVSNLMLANPSAKKISKIFEPVMRRLFNVPGIGAGAFVLGTVCGFPSGAIACSDMYTKGYLTQSEAERLSSFTSNAGPVFIVGAVGASMFGSVYIGFLLMAVHIAAGIIVGISFRFKDADSRNYKISAINTKYDEIKPKEPFGKTMSDSIIKSVNTSLLVGGFIVIFAVIICKS